MKRNTLAIVLLLIASILMACDVTQLGDTPEQGAKEFLQAIADSDGIKLDDRTCVAQKQALQSGALLSTAIGIAAGNIVGQKPKIDVSEVKITTTSNSGGIASVGITGNLRIAIGLAVQSQPLDETWQMRKEGDKWKFCGDARVQNPGQPSSSFTPAPQGITVRVSGTEDWQSSGLSVQSGDTLRIHYISDRWSPWPGGQYDANGVQFDPTGARIDCRTETTDNSVIGGVCHASLIGRIANSIPFYVGKDYAQTVGSAGLVYLRINDKKLSDNAGSILVNIAVTH